MGSVTDTARTSIRNRTVPAVAFSGFHLMGAVASHGGLAQPHCCGPIGMRSLPFSKTPTQIDSAATVLQ